MRTTVSIPEDLLRDAKRAAAGAGRTLSELVEDGLRLLLARHEVPDVDATSLPVFGGSGLRPGVDLEDKEGLAALLDEPADARAAG
jgi:Arc/MetJ-type ribon-helix-helix transcriptional regulator